MRKIITFLSLILICLSCVNFSAQAAEPELRDDTIYFFYYNECPYCHKAMDYMNQKYPTLHIAMVNIHNPGGFDIILKCAKKFKLGRNIGTPLFCMGDNYVMGWSEESQKEFDEYVIPFLKAQKKEK